MRDKPSILLQFITYQTPSKFLIDFNEHSGNLNLWSIKVISSLLLIVSCFARSLSFIAPEKVALVKGYQQLSLNNWIQIIGCLCFLLIIYYAKKHNLTTRTKKAITLAFVAYILTMAFNISYIVSMHNTKNTLFMFLIGIMVASLFFTIEYKHMKFVVVYIVGVYFAATFLSDIAIQDKMMNVVAGFILGVVLLSFSRYSYYFKSNHFIQIKELEEKNKEILLLNNQKTEILSFVAHDLRSPLNNIDALSQIILMEDADNREMKMISNSATQAKNIINDLVEAIKTEHADIQKERIHLNSYIDRIVSKWETNTTRKINYKHIGEELNLQANASKLERVMDNLISNAFKFSSIDQPVVITSKKLANHILIEITDYGVGIPTELQKYAFDQFSKASRKGLLGEKSMGLGLHISQKIIEQHQGSLSLKSKENEGTTFTIQLPA